MLIPLNTKLGENAGTKHNLIIHFLGDCKMDGILTSKDCRLMPTHLIRNSGNIQNHTHFDCSNYIINDILTPLNIHPVICPGSHLLLGPGCPS